MGWLQIAVFVALLLALAVPVGHHIAHVARGERKGLVRWSMPLERLLLRACGLRGDEETSWKAYARAFLVFHFVGFVFLYFVQRVQHRLPLNPNGLGAVSADSSFNTSISFVTNTNWQGYAGETTLSHLTQMVGLGTQNFVSAAAGIAVLFALIRGLTRKESSTIGSFWTDLVRATVHVLLPLSLLLGVALVSQGVVQTFDGHVTAQLTVPAVATDGGVVTEQSIALGPVASQVAIKQLGTNGGGFFNANAAHPFENPTPLSNLLELLAILLLPTALCTTFGVLVGDRRQGRALLAAMLIVFVPCVIATWRAEAAGTTALERAGVELAASDEASGGNMEGKEVRHGVAGSALWAVATTAASNGSVNSMHDSFTPLGGLWPMWLMQLGEVVFGGVGSGLYGLLMFAIVAVFIAGLMVGRTPEYLGKKLGSFETKMASVAILAPCLAALIGTAVAVALPDGRSGMLNQGAHGFSEVLYAFSSASNNNGSAFAGLSANTPFFNALLGVAMLVGRFLVALPVLAIAGSLARKKVVPPGAGTLPTHDALFVVLLVGTVLLVGALTFLPALALGPLVEQLQMHVGGAR